MFGKKPIVIEHPLAYELYHYHLGRAFDAGVPREVFIPKFDNPVYKAATGRGGHFAGQFRTMQPAQAQFRAQIGITGLGGIQTGGIVFQPLIDPSVSQD